jgi:hypothetical protein
LLQVKSHFVPSQVGAPPAGAVHAVHEVVPHDAVLLFWLQTPPQSWLPAGQVPAQDMALSMQAPAHSFLPAGQVPLQVPFARQVGVPPFTAGQAMQDEPHVATSALLAQVVPHRW